MPGNKKLFKVKGRSNKEKHRRRMNIMKAASLYSRAHNVTLTCRSTGDGVMVYKLVDIE
jgi:hypothetical protein